MTHLTTGIHRLEAEDYHADRMCAVPTLSSTLARLLITRSPRHAWTASARLNPDHVSIESKAFDVGRAAHRAVLGAGGDYAVCPDELLSDDGGMRSKAAREWLAETRAAGLTPLKPDEAEAVETMAGSIRDRLDAFGIRLDPERSELTALAEIDGVMCRAMVDNAPADPRAPLLDIKTCQNAHPDAVIRSVCEWGYDVQIAHYLDVWEAATGERRRMRLVFVEKAPPHEVSVIELLNDPGDDADWMADARSKCAEARRIWAECLSDDQWPGYPPQVALLGAPVWHRSNWAARETGLPVTPAALARAKAWQAPHDGEAA